MFPNKANLPNFPYSNQLSKLLPICLVLAAVWGIFGAGLSKHQRNFLNPNIYNDDARAQVAPMLKFYDAELFQNDYIVDYYIKAFSPPGYTALFRVAAKFVNPIPFAKYLSYALWLLTLIGIGLTANYLGGPLLLFGTLLYAVPMLVIPERLIGGLPRSFGFPFVAFGIYFIARGELRRLAALALLGLAFYPTAGVLLGTSIGALTILPDRLRGEGERWKPTSRLLFLLLLGAAACGVASFQYLGGKEYGPRVSDKDAAVFPETGRGGRFAVADRADGAGFFLPALPTYLKSFYLSRRQGVLESGPINGLLGIPHSAFPMIGEAKTILLGLLLITPPLLAFVQWRRKALTLSPACIRIGVFFLSTLFIYELSRLLSPALFTPQRYLTYGIPLLGCLYFPAVILFLVKTFSSHKARCNKLTGTLALLIAFVLLGRYIEPLAGTMPLKKGVGKFMSAVGKLPKNSIIAGFAKQELNNIPYFAARSVLFNFETHQAFHADFLLELRRRMTALIEAQYATDIQQILRLQREYRVTHLVVHTDQIGREIPFYFQPFKEQIQDYIASQRATGREFILPKLLPTCSIYNRKKLYLCELARLSQTNLNP